MRSTRAWRLAAILCSASLAFTALAGDDPAPGDAPPAWVNGLQPAKKKLIADKMKTATQRRADMERDLKKLRFDYFRQSKGDKVRAEGLEKLKAYTDPIIFPAMIEIFRTESMDVRQAVMDHLAAQKNDAGDAALAWIAVYDKDEAMRGSARERLMGNVKDTAAPVSDAVKIVIYTGLTKGSDEEMSAAARAGNVLNIAEAIPWLINTQAGGQAAQVGDNSTNHQLAWIMVARQVAFVSDLTPVVGPSAVAFDPQLSVVNEGTLLRVIDATVVTYHIDINRELIDLSSRLYEQPTRGLGWNLPAWREWYTKDFKPYWTQKLADQKREEAERLASKMSEKDKK